MKLIPLLSLFLLLSSFNSKPAADEFSLVGSWQTTEDGETYEISFLANGKVELILEEEDAVDGEVLEGTYKTDNTKKPMHLDMTISEDGELQTARVIYRFLGNDIMEIGSSEKGPEIRPTAFEKEYTLVLNRLK